MSFFFDFGGQPRFDERSSGEHGGFAEDVVLEYVLFVVGVGEDVAVADDGEGGGEVWVLGGGDSFYVVPVGEFVVALES